jgi:hypothetical protein
VLLRVANQTIIISVRVAVGSSRLVLVVCDHYTSHGWFSFSRLSALFTRSEGVNL